MRIVGYDEELDGWLKSLPKDTLLRVLTLLESFVAAPEEAAESFLASNQLIKSFLQAGYRDGQKMLLRAYKSFRAYSDAVKNGSLN